LVEYGVFGQSVSHAHTHFIPSESISYPKIDIIKDFVLPSIEKHKVPFEKTDIYGLKEIFNQDKQYLFFEQNDETYVLRTKGFKKEDIINDFAYRHFFVTKGIGMRSWKEMTDGQKIQDKLNIEKSKDILDF